jgi:hypothetical protein
MKSNTAEIIFKPVCSNCGEILNCDVEWYASSHRESEITPVVCPHCNCVFDNIRIVIPTNNYSFKYSPDKEWSTR